MNRDLLISLPAVLCCLALSCGRPGQLPTAKVSGKVTLDGKPVPVGLVIFTPESGRSASGKIQPDGTYVLETYDENDGAVLGRHRLGVMARETIPGQGPMGSPKPGPSLIPERYGSAETSGLSFEVTDNGPHVFNIELSSRN